MIDLDNKEILVTGGAGFIGSNIINKLIVHGAKVTVLDNLFTGFKSLVPDHPNVSFIEGDVTDKKLVDELLAKYKLVIHAAAKNIIVSTNNPFEDFETNIGGTLNLLLAAELLNLFIPDLLLFMEIHHSCL